MVLFVCLLLVRLTLLPQVKAGNLDFIHPRERQIFNELKKKYVIARNPYFTEKFVYMCLFARKLDPAQTAALLHNHLVSGGCSGSLCVAATLVLIFVADWRGAEMAHGKHVHGSEKNLRRGSRAAFLRVTPPPRLHAPRFQQLLSPSLCGCDLTLPSRARTCSYTYYIKGKRDKEGRGIVYACMSKVPPRKKHPDVQMQHFLWFFERLQHDETLDMFREGVVYVEDILGASKPPFLAPCCLHLCAPCVCAVPCLLSCCSPNRDPIPGLKNFDTFDKEFRKAVHVRVTSVCFR